LPGKDPVFNAPPIVLRTIMVLGLCYLGFALAPPALQEAAGDGLGFEPARFFAGPSANGGVVPMVGRLFTHMFVHASLAHILFNSLWLLAFGAPVARRLGTAWRFLALFLLSGAAGALFFSLFHHSDYTLLVGASGGVTGLLGALIRFGFQRPPVFSDEPPPLLGLFHPTVLAWSAVIIALNVSTEFFGAGFGAGDADIAWEAHVGGLLFGLVAISIFDPPRVRRF
jgi:membrane associated rhomboid family serine protease